ncbi:MAG TPA: nodulation protein NfeD [Actinomycetota bacterium]|jgi:membrane-bound serine protease (ClpP class)|nr:nodulation protein NfeD [Actinomycetota bacterium]
MGRVRLGVEIAFLALTAVALVTMAGVAAGASDAGLDAAARPQVLRLSLTGVVDPFMASYVQRGIHAAAAGHDTALAITIDTPGGLDSSMREIVGAILSSPIPVICYVPPGGRAASAGTFVMLACPVNGMAPGSAIGAAHPVGVSGAIEQAKVTNDAAAFIRSLAERTGRNGGWAENAVRESISADAASALDLHVVDFVAPSLPALLDQVGGCGASVSKPLANVCPAATVSFHRSLAESFFHGFADPNVAFILLDIGFLALIVWAFHPGFHVPLAVGVVSSALGLAILETLPVRLAGFGLLLVAAVLFVLDLKARAHGVLTVGGIVVFVLGGLLLFNPSVPNARISPPLLFSLPVVVGVASAFLLRAMLAARRTPLRAGPQTLMGAHGVAETALDPLGRVRVRGESWSAESVGDPVPAGTPVLIIAVRGLTLDVFPEGGSL